MEFRPRGVGPWVRCRLSEEGACRGRQSCGWGWVRRGPGWLSAVGGDVSPAIGKLDNSNHASQFFGYVKKRFTMYRAMKGKGIIAICRGHMLEKVYFNEDCNTNMKKESQ